MRTEKSDLKKKDERGMSDKKEEDFTREFDISKNQMQRREVKDEKGNSRKEWRCCF